MIQEQFAEVFEVFFIMKGKVGVGYRLFNEIFLGMALKERKVVNEYALMHDRVSEFLYKPIIEHVEGLAMRRAEFREMIEDPYWKKFLPQWDRHYKKRIQNVVTEHRDETSQKFKNRIDYVDLGAFGVGIGEGPNIAENQIKEFN